VASLFGVEARADLFFWHFEGVRAGAVLIVLFPLLFTIFSVCVVMFFPIFRLFVIASKGPRLRFEQEFAECLCLSRLQCRSYVKLSAIFGLLLGLFQSILLLALTCADIGEVSSAAFPLFFHGVARLIWIVIAAPIFLSIYSVAIAIFAFVPFRLITRAFNGGTIPSKEFVPCG
jgi:hypothetical protein